MWGAPGSGFLSPNNVEPGIVRGHHSNRGHRVRVRRDEVPILGLFALAPTDPGIVACGLALLDRVWATICTTAGAAPRHRRAPNGVTTPSGVREASRGTLGSRLGLVNRISIRRCAEDNAVWWVAA